jgi:hypothetical protein
MPCLCKLILIAIREYHALSSCVSLRSARVPSAPPHVLVGSLPPLLVAASPYAWDTRRLRTPLGLQALATALALARGESCSEHRAPRAGASKLASRLGRAHYSHGRF